MFKRQKDFQERLMNDFDKLNAECNTLFKSKFKEQPKINLHTGNTLENNGGGPNPEKPYKEPSAVSNKIASPSILRKPKLLIQDME